MRSKRVSEPLSAIVRRKILPGLFASVSFSALSPFVLGYALYRLLVGAALVPQDAFFLVGLVTSFSLAWGLSSCIVAFLKVRHLMVRPLERLASAAAYRTDCGSVEPFRLKTRVREQALLIGVFNRLFGCQDERLAELVDLIHVFGHNASRYSGHVSDKANLCLDPVVPPERRKEHLAELPRVAIEEIGALDDHLCQCVGIVDNYNRIKGPPFAARAEACERHPQPAGQCDQVHARGRTHFAVCLASGRRAGRCRLGHGLRNCRGLPRAGLRSVLPRTGSRRGGRPRPRAFVRPFRRAVLRRHVRLRLGSGPGLDLYGHAAAQGGSGGAGVRALPSTGRWSGMNLIPRSDRKRVYALLAAVPALLCYLTLLGYMYFGEHRFLADGVLLASVVGETAVLTILLTKLKIGWWLRRWRFALVRLVVILVSMFVSTLAVLLHVMT